VVTVIPELVEGPSLRIATKAKKENPSTACLRQALRATGGGDGLQEAVAWHSRFDRLKVSAKGNSWQVGR